MSRRVRLAHRRLPLRALALPLGLALSGPAWTGTVSIEVPPGGKAATTVVITAAAGGGSGTVTTKDGGVGDRDPRAGHIEVATGIDQNDIKSIVIKAVGPAASAPAPAASAASAPTKSSMKFGDAGLASFEPVDLPRFMSTDTTRVLLSMIDVPTYQASTGQLPEPGDLLAVLGGSVPGLAGLELYDATSLYGTVDSFFDVFVDLELVDLGQLPRWQGEIWVDSMVQFRVVPEPLGAALAALALLAAAGVGRGGGGRLAPARATPSGGRTA